MAPQRKTSSLQDILKRRQRSDFVGREEQITLFRRNLALSLDDDRRRFIFNIAGQGGVGKTWLLRRFRELARERRHSARLIIMKMTSDERGYWTCKKNGLSI